MGELTEEVIVNICIAKASGKSNVQVAGKLGISEDDVRKVVREKKEEIGELKGQLQEYKANKYEKLFKKSLKALEDILETDSEVPVFDKDGNKTGAKINTDILKLKKDIAHELLESIGIKKVSKGGGIHIDNRTANISGKDNKKEKLEKLEKAEVKQLLDDCKIEPKEVKYTGSLN